MDWDVLFGWYTLLCSMLGWPGQKVLKRILGPTKICVLGAILLLANLLVFLWRPDLFIHSSMGLELRFVLYPSLLLGLLSCYDCIRYQVHRLFRKEGTETDISTSSAAKLR
ncbi:MAG: hypothetical protein BWY25_01575 [Chloroflexi bacterium ADurb.Bin222]|nr:MAG: hypothetical protein BWY25_01575 [Chloroflexi bacterium ADurb.Bin222]